MTGIVFAVVALALGAAAAGPATAQQPGARGPVVLLGTGGLRWDDISADLPALSALEADSTGLLAVRSVRSTTCPADGWLAVSAGQRAADVPAPGCRTLDLEVATPGGATTVPRWSEYVDAAGDESFDARPGLLGDTLLAEGKTTAAVGPGAAIALATPSPDGRQASVAHAFEGAVDGAAGTVDPTQLAEDVQRALALNPDVLVVDLGEIRDPAQRGSGDPALTGAFATPRAEQLRRLDTRLGLVLGQMPKEATVVIASLADAGDVSQLRLAAARGPAPVSGPDGERTFGGSLLTSRSTRQDGVAQGTDLTPTILAAAGVDTPADAVGSPLRPVAGGNVVDRLQRMSDVDQAATAVHPIVPWFSAGTVGAQVVLYGAAAIGLRAGRGRADTPAAGLARRRTLRLLQRTAVVFAAVPAATYLANLVPWWRGQLPGLSVTVIVVGFVIPIALAALLGPWASRPLGSMGVVGGLTAAVLAGDVLFGSHLMLSSLMGVQPVIAGRWYGFSNPGFALFATGCLLLAIAVADPLVRAGRIRAAAGAIVGIGLVATVIDGTPGLGSDFGGPPAIIPAFGVLALLVAGVRITWARAAAMAGITVAVLAALSLLDWLRPAQERTHLGRFVQTLLDGGAGSVVQRKLMQNVEILFGSWYSALLPLAAVFVVLVLARPVRWGVRPLQAAYDRSPVLRHGVVAFVVLVGIGFAMNDSGTAIPAVAATLALPLLIAVSARALELDDADRLAAAIARTRRPTKPRR